MSGNAGDAHIWTITTEPVPVAECGYSPPLVDIEDADGNVIGQQVAHAEPTGDTCAACIDATQPPVVPDTEAEGE